MTRPIAPVNQETRDGGRLNGRGLVTITLPVAALLAVLGWMWTVEWARPADPPPVESAQEATIGDHEARLRVLEKQTATIAADVSWIRHELEEKL